MVQTREKILLSFRELARERGFYDATVDELALRSGVSKRTIYRHFSSKEELIEEVMLKFLKETEQVIDRAIVSADNAPDKITNFIKALTERLRGENPRALRDLQKHYPAIWDKLERFRAGKLEKFINIIIEGSKEGHFKPINPTVVTAAFLATIRAVGNPTFIMENNLTPEETFNTVMNILLYGIADRAP